MPPPALSRLAQSAPDGGGTGWGEDGRTAGGGTGSLLAVPSWTPPQIFCLRVHVAFGLRLPCGGCQVVQKGIKWCEMV